MYDKKSSLLGDRVLFYQSQLDFQISEPDMINWEWKGEILWQFSKKGCWFIC